MTTGIRKPGQFSWINMLTPDTAKARDFFGAVLGWTYLELPGMGHIVLVGGKDVGGLWDLHGPNTPPGTPPLIGVMVKVASADETAAKAAALGGRSKPPFDIMDQGRMAVCTDPNGAEFDIWEARKGPGMAVDSNPMARRAGSRTSRATSNGAGHSIARSSGGLRRPCRRRAALSTPASSSVTSMWRA